MKTPRRSSTPQKKKFEKRREKDITPAPSKQQDETRLEMEVEPLFSNIPGCSTDAEYMNREVQWPEGRDSTPWNTQTEEIKFKNNISSVKSNTKFKEAIVKSDESSKLRKRIRVIENRQLVPPSNPHFLTLHLVVLNG